MAPIEGLGAYFIRCARWNRVALGGFPGDLVHHLFRHVAHQHDPLHIGEQSQLLLQIGQAFLHAGFFHRVAILGRFDRVGQVDAYVQDILHGFHW